MFLSLSRGNVCLSCFYDNHFQFSKIFITHKPESQFPKLNKKQFWGFSLKWRGIERKPWKNRSSWVLLTSLQYSTHRRMLPLFPTHPDVVWIRNVLIGTCIRALVPSWWCCFGKFWEFEEGPSWGKVTTRNRFLKVCYPWPPPVSSASCQRTVKISCHTHSPNPEILFK